MRKYKKLIQCDGCPGHAIGVSTDNYLDGTNDHQVYIEWWATGCHWSYGFWDRLKRAYKFFKDGTFEPNDVILSVESAEQYVDAIIEAINVCNETRPVTFEYEMAMNEELFKLYRKYGYSPHARRFEYTVEHPRSAPVEEIDE